jgi:proteic killer suppression protein
MVIQFKNVYLEQIYIGEPLKGKPKYSSQVVDKFIKRVDALKNLSNAEELFKLKSFSFERLKGNKKHLFSIRINDQYRIEFELDNEVLKLAEIVTIEEISKHYEK